MNRFIFFLAFMGFLFNHLEVAATHVVGGDVTYEWVGKDSIKITITEITDCDNAGNGGSKFFYLRSAGFNDYLSCQISSFKIADITPLCKKGCSYCQSSSCSFKFGYKKYAATGIFSVKKYRKNGGCKISIQSEQSARTEWTTNGGAKEFVATFAEFNLCDSVLYDSPKWRTVPGLLLCQNDDVKLDLGATHPKRELEMRYFISNPNNAAGNVKYNSPYSFRAPLTFLGFPKFNGLAPKGFRLDSTTGTLSFRPTKVEGSVVGVTAKTFLKGKLISEISREVTLLVMKCASNSPPILSGTDCSTLSNQNLIINTCAGKPICFAVCASDPDTTDTLELSYKGELPGASLKQDGDTGTFCWQPSSGFVSDNPYQFTITASDGICPLPKTTHNTYSIYVREFDTATLVLTKTKLNNCGQYEFSLSDTSGGFHHETLWFLNDSIPIGTGKTTKYTFKKSGTYKVSAQYNGCKKEIVSATVSLSGLTPLEITPMLDTTICAHEDLVSTLNTTGGHGPIQYSWSHGSVFTNLLKKDSSAAKFRFPNTPGVISYKVDYRSEDSAGCAVSGSFSVNVKGYSQQDIELGTSFCTDSDTAYPLALFNAVSGWSGNGVKNDTFFSQLSPRGSQVLVYKQELSKSCVIDSAVINSFPSAKINPGKDFSICLAVSDTLLQGSPKSGTWTGNGIVSGQYFSSTTAGMGAHQLYYESTDSNGCSGTDSIMANVVNYEPAIVSEDSISKCSYDDPIKIKATPAGGRWFGGGLASSTNEVTFSPSLVVPGVFELVYELVDSNKCQNQDTTIVIVHRVPVADFTVFDSVVWQGDTLKIKNTTTEVNGTDYTWTITGPQSKVATGFEPTVKLDSLGLHSVTLSSVDQMTGCENSLSRNESVLVILNTGLHGSDHLAGIKLFPNPVEEQFTIVNPMDGAIELELISIKGDLLFQSRYSKGYHKIDVSALAPGTYQIILHHGNDIDHRVLLKK